MRIEGNLSGRDGVFFLSMSVQRALASIRGVFSGVNPLPGGGLGRGDTRCMALGVKCIVWRNGESVVRANIIPFSFLLYPFLVPVLGKILKNKIKKNMLPSRA